MCDKPLKSMSRSHYLIIIPFLIIMTFFSIAFLIYPDQMRSETENRMLAQRPVFDVENIPSLPKDIEKYYNDQFPWRESFLEMLSRLELTMNKTSIRNLYISNGFLLPPEFLCTDSQLSASAKKVNELMAFVESKGKTGAYISLPYKTSVYNYLLPPYLQTDYGTRNFKNFTSKLSTKTRICDAFRCYEGQNQADLETYFFKTDLHWNYRGAEIAFRYILDWLCKTEMIKGMSLDAIPSGSVLLKDNRYLGDLNRRYSFLFPVDEEVPVFSEVDTDVKYYLSYLSDEFTLDRHAITSNPPGNGIATYNSVYCNNLGYYKMVNEESLSNAKVMIIKDSMQNAMTDLLSQVFRVTEVIDIRYLEEATLDEIISTSAAELVLLMYHQNNVTGEMFDFGLTPQ